MTERRILVRGTAAGGSRKPREVVYDRSRHGSAGQRATGGATLTLSDHLQALIEHVRPVITGMLVHSGDLPRELVARHVAEESTPVEVDSEEVERLGVRLREADLLSDEVGAGIRHDANRLAEEVHKTALVYL